MENNALTTMLSVVLAFMIVILAILLVIYFVLRSKKKKYLKQSLKRYQMQQKQRLNKLPQNMENNLFLISWNLMILLIT